MSGMVATLGRRFPMIKQIEHGATHPSKSLPELKHDIWRMRGEYWYRRVQSYPETIKQARTDAVDVWHTKLSKPGTWTWGDAVAAGIIGVQVIGAFAIGEALGRGSLIGYNVGGHGHH